MTSVTPLFVVRNSLDTTPPPRLREQRRKRAQKYFPGRLRTVNYIAGAEPCVCVRGHGGSPDVAARCGRRGVLRSAAPPCTTCAPPRSDSHGLRRSRQDVLSLVATGVCPGQKGCTTCSFPRFPSSERGLDSCRSLHDEGPGQRLGLPCCLPIHVPRTTAAPPDPSTGYSGPFPRAPRPIRSEPSATTFCRSRSES